MPAATLALLGQTDSVDALAHPVPGRRWPRALAALTVRNYRLFLSAQVIATTGLWMQRIAQTMAGPGVERQRRGGGHRRRPAISAGAHLRPGRRGHRRSLSKAHHLDGHPDGSRNAGGHAGTPRVDRNRPGVAGLSDRHPARFRHGGGQPHPPGVRRRTGRRQTRPQRGQPQLLGVPVRGAGRSRALRISDPRGGPGLVILDQRGLLPRRGDHAGHHPAETRSGDGTDELRANCERVCATSGTSRRSAGPSFLWPRWASSGSTCR